MNPILILDFGSQFSHLIANRIRRLTAASEIIPADSSAEYIASLRPAGIILSGGPQSVFASDSPQPDPEIFDINVPFLGICYGHQLLAHHFGGKIISGQKEFGKAQLTVLSGRLFDGVPKKSSVWMNHSDSVVSLPQGFEKTAQTAECEYAGFENQEKNIFSVQFHPEVTHTEEGMNMLDNFVQICGSQGSWNIAERTEAMFDRIREDVGERNVFLLVSGGVDSSVAFALLNKALGKDRVFGLLVDHGLMRKNEVRDILAMMNAAGFPDLHVAEKSEYFLQKLDGLTDPEEKRNAIGNAFLDVQREVAKQLGLDGENWLLGQGTIYPDHIETGGTEHASTIKTHHNRVPEIEQMISEGRVIEPLVDFYKDEVREIGRQLGLPAEVIDRHPFPGPGLGVRILCQEEVCPLTDSCMIESHIADEYGVSAGILPVQSVGVQGDARSYRHPCVLFGLASPRDATTLAADIPNGISEINRILVCLSHTHRPDQWFSPLPARITKKRITLLQEADALVGEILREEGVMGDVWQFPVVLLPLGLQKNTESIVLRPIHTENVMTATAVLFSDAILQKISSRILTALPQISAVFLDMTSKPPGTVEWE